MPEPYLGSPSGTIEILRKYNISARKKFGQNFLIDDGVLSATVDAAELTPEDAVLEIGPGIGTLTQYLAASAGNAVAVEIDRSLLPVLADTLSGFDNVEVISGDILKTDIKEIVDTRNNGRPIKVVANLPYYITTPIIMQLLESGAPIESITVMVQKEVADRMTAEPGSRDFGALSLAIRYYAEPCVAQIVHPDSFIPQPGVDSAVVTLLAHTEPPVSVKDPGFMFQLIRASFNQRRKKLSNGILNFPGYKVGDREGVHFTRADVEGALTAAGLDPNIRGEAMSLAQFADLADRLLGKVPGSD